MDVSLAEFEEKIQAMRKLVKELEEAAEPEAAKTIKRRKGKRAKRAEQGFEFSRKPEQLEPEERKILNEMRTAAGLPLVTVEDVLAEGMEEADLEELEQIVAKAPGQGKRA